MDREEAQARMEEIQRIMETATLWTLLPGTAAVLGGVLVLIGCGVSYSMFRSLDFADMLKIVPGAYCIVGHAGTVALHNPAFKLDPEILPIGASVMARMVEKRLPL